MKKRRRRKTRRNTMIPITGARTRPDIYSAKVQI